MRRPLSIMRANAEQGWIEVLFKVVGEGLLALGDKKPGDSVNVIGPIGVGFSADPKRPEALLIGGGVGIPPMVFLAEQMHEEAAGWRPTVLMGSEIPFPFELTRSALPTDWLSADVRSTMPLMEKWQLPCRLASLSDFKGCYKGFVTDLSRQFLTSQSAEQRALTAIFACGPTPMLKAVAALAAEFDLPCQVSLEEFMACGVGGCAGCGVLVQTDDGPAIQGGFDYEQGLFYAGTWASSVDFGDNTTMELDLYGGIAPTWNMLSFDIGALYYAYPGAPELATGTVPIISASAV